ncbi:hypothetical protein WN51_03479 [Melipona quadrifasciata]|uniref:Uncharacterized protein n=1 Tax=Melipona quadrifasciata TaxID=166423 RepID=A0A0M8ZU77_9HYME|nr:hypothetical protein WN51_03479 [Melipona quadrifasciata]
MRGGGREKVTRDGRKRENGTRPSTDASTRLNFYHRGRRLRENTDRECPASADCSHLANAPEIARITF